jgi:hypothetical protein
VRRRGPALCWIAQPALAPGCQHTVPATAELPARVNTSLQTAADTMPRLRGPDSPAGEHRQDFKQAWEAKDIDALIGILHPDATGTGDGGGLVSAVLRPVEGGEQIARFFVDRGQCGTQREDPGAYGRRSARPGGPAGRRHRDGVRVRHRRRQDHAHLGNTQTRQAPALDDWLARVSMPSGPLPAADAWGQQHARHRDPPFRRRRRRCHRRAPRSRRWRLRPVRAVSAG